MRSLERECSSRVRRRGRGVERPWGLSTPSTRLDRMGGRVSLERGVIASIGGSAKLMEGGRTYELGGRDDVPGREKGEKAGSSHCGCGSRVNGGGMFSGGRYANGVSACSWP